MRLARLCALAALCCAPAACRKNAPPHTVGLALDVGGRGDQSFNDGALRGLETMAAGLRYTPRGYEPSIRYCSIVKFFAAFTAARMAGSGSLLN